MSPPPRTRKGCARSDNPRARRVLPVELSPRQIHEQGLRLEAQYFRLNPFYQIFSRRAGSKLDIFVLIPSTKSLPPEEGDADLPRRARVVHVAVGREPVRVALQLRACREHTRHATSSQHATHNIVRNHNTRDAPPSEHTRHAPRSEKTRNAPPSEHARRAVVRTHDTQTRQNTRHAPP